MNKKIIYLEILRLIACFFVIVNHTHGLMLSSNSLINTIIYCIDFSLCKIAVPIFFMITGILILEKKYTYKKVFKCISKIFVPLFVISLCFYIKDIGLSQFDFISFVKCILEEPYIFSYWYLYALIGFYLCVPFTQKFVKKINKKDYFPFMFLFMIIPSFINMLGSLFAFTVNEFLFNTIFSFVLCFPICGLFISKLELNKNYLKKSLILFFVSYMLMICFMFIPYIINGEISYLFDSWNSFPVVLMSISSLYIFRYLFEECIFSKKEENFILTLSSTTFGIYLIHTFLIYELFDFILINKIYIFNEVLGTFILEIFIFIVSFILIYILKRIPIVKNYL